MAVKIVRQENRIALLGAPVSAAALAPGGEGAPAALRAAGLIPKLLSIGYDVVDSGDDPIRVWQSDDESPRARNLRNVLAALESLRPRVELAIKSGALPLILGGDCSVALAVVAGLRRYFRNVSLVYADADADLQTPATTPSGCIDGMVVSHLVGRGASEMVRFWSEPPLVREPDLALFGVSRLDPAEEQTLQTSALRRYLADDIRRKSPARAASDAIERIHGNSHDFVLHFDVDAIDGFTATNLPASGGLSADELREAFAVFVAKPHLAVVEVAGYNPARDADGSGARFIVDFLADVLSIRKETVKAAAAAAASQTPARASADAATHSAGSANIPAGDANIAAAEAADSSAASALAPSLLPNQPETDAADEAADIGAAAPGEPWSSDLLDQPAPREDADSLENPSSADSEDPQP